MAQRREREGFRFTKFQIQGKPDGPIPGVFVPHPSSPRGKLILFLHGLGGRKEDVLEFSLLAMPLGFSMLAIDAMRHGERESDMAGMSPTEMISGLGGTVVDNRLALDVAFGNGWAEQGKVILAGVSMGGILGGVVAGADERITGAALYVPGGDMTEILAKSKHPTVSQLRKGIPPLALRLARGQLSSIDPINYVDRISPRPLLIQLGKHDDVVPFENGMKLFDKAKEPKDLVVHESGHELPREKALSETEEWLRRRLPGLTSPE